MATTPARTRLPGTDPRRAIGVIFVGALGTVAAAATQVNFAEAGDRSVYFATALAAALYLAIGCWVWLRRPRAPIGALMSLVGVFLVLSTFAASANAATALFGTLVSVLVLAAGFHLMVAFPLSRITRPAERIFVAICYLTAVTGQVAGTMAAGSGAEPVVRIANTTSALTLGTIATVVLWRRLRQWPPRRSRASVPFFCVSGIAMLVMPLIPASGVSPFTSFVLQLVLIVAIPLAFAVSILRGGLARDTALNDLDGDVRAGFSGDRRALQMRLAGLLGDSQLRVGVRDAEGAMFIDDEGEPLGTESRRTVLVIEEAVPAAAIDYDPTTIDDQDDLTRAAHIVRAALERDAVTTQLLTSRNEVRRSRARIAAATNAERQRMTAALHDGAQMHLVLLSLETAKLKGLVPEAAQGAIDDLRRGIDALAAEIRAIVTDVLPPALEERGLESAISDLLDRTALETSLSSNLPPGVLADDVERAAYFIVSEAVTNVLKHADATIIEVRLEYQTDTMLRIHIIDNGVGAQLGGHAIRSIADRAQAAGGTLRVAQATPEGTHLIVSLGAGLSSEREPADSDEQDREQYRADSTR